MYASTAKGTFPVMAIPRGWVSAFMHKSLLVLFGVGGLCTAGLVVDVVSWVFVDGLNPGHGILVDLAVIFIERLLPLLFCFIIVLLGPFPCSQAGIPLSSAEMWFGPWLIWCAGLGTDIQCCDLGLLCRIMDGINIHEVVLLFGSGPGFPYSN